MATFEKQIQDLATAVGNTARTINSKIGALTSLTTSDKTTIVAAINEVRQSISSFSDTVNSFSTRLGTAETGISTNKSELATAKANISTLQGTVGALEDAVDALEEAVNRTEINDNAVSTDTAWSSSKTNSVINDAKQAVKNEILNGAGTAYDTLKELADLIITNASAIEALTALAAGHVRYDEAQTLTEAQKTQARANIDTISTVQYNALSQSVSTNTTNIGTVSTNLSNLTTQLGNITNADFVATFEAAYNGS